MSLTAVVPLPRCLYMRKQKGCTLKLERKQSNATSRGVEAVRNPAYDDNRNREAPVKNAIIFFL